MKLRNAAAFLSMVVLAAVFGAAHAQPGEPKMFPGTDFPGNDLYDVQAGSPDECAGRCMADNRCTAFTYRFGEKRCFLKWAASRFDGSGQAQSGLIQGRPITPPGAGTAAPALQAPAVIVVPVGPTTSCKAQGNQACEGCSVTCPAGKQAMCTEGELTSGNPPMCWTKTKCECK
jgi:hypothetical protein